MDGNQENQKSETDEVTIVAEGEERVGMSSMPTLAAQLPFSDATPEPILPKVCLNCGNPINGLNRKFCNNNLCNSITHKYRTNPEYREKLKARAKKYYTNNKEVCKVKCKAYFKIWLSKPENRKKFNEQMRIANKLRWRRLHVIRESQNLCMRCGGSRDTSKKNCSTCLEKMRLMSKK